ncbi:MAG: DUF4215 domain-containing protein [Nanoarchaeota archaeon]|nr:DUF4215 domain-containing protein [Nanoarchaeota archaeon]
MNKKVIGVIFVFSILVLSISFASAFSFSDFWDNFFGKMTGKAVSSNECTIKGYICGNIDGSGPIVSCSKKSLDYVRDISLDKTCDSSGMAGCCKEKVVPLINGKCGINNGGNFSELLYWAGDNCIQGNVTSFNSNLTGWEWGCQGINGGTNAKCSAGRYLANKVTNINLTNQTSNIINSTTNANQSLINQTNINKPDKIVSPVCGNNILEKEEECDDGNLIDSDRCSKNCIIEEISKTDLESKTCARVFGDGDENAMNIFIIGAGYNENEIYCNYRCDDSNDYKNLQNDINRMLFSRSKTLGYGLLTVEPFASNLDKINVFMITKPYNFHDQSKLFSFFKDNCGISMVQERSKNNFIVVINGYGEGEMIVQAQAYRSDFYIFLHEFGHLLGLRDEYATPYNPSGIMGDSSLDVSYSIPNCDTTPGCPKWCNGKSVPSSEIVSQFVEKYNNYLCTNYLTQNECNAHKNEDCLWLKQKDPYFNSQCIKNSFIPDDLNLGTDCLEGTGCYWGCTGYGYRPTKGGNFATIETQRIDKLGKRHTYDPVSERYLSDLFECSFPTSCENYDYKKCSDFFSRYLRFESFKDICNVKTCSNCGEGFWDICDKSKCESINDNCHFTKEFVGGLCTIN